MKAIRGAAQRDPVGKEETFGQAEQRGRRPAPSASTHPEVQDVIEFAWTDFYAPVLSRLGEGNQWLGRKMNTHRATIDLITQRPDGAFVMVLVEQGPWEDTDIMQSLRRLQDRLYDYVEIAIDGHLVKLFPEAAGKPVWIRVDCYDTPDEEVRSFLKRFETLLRESNEYDNGILPLDSLHFEYNLRRLDETG